MLALLALVLFALFAAAANWFVHHPRKWLAQKCDSLPSIVTLPLLAVGNPCGDLTDAFGWTGHDAVYEYDEEAPSGSVLFAGSPRRTGMPCPDDIVEIDRGDFLIGWSPSLRHPVWVAYHVVPESRYEISDRPDFRRDPIAANSARPNDYTRSGYDRGHMAPNHAIASRYGKDAQAETFLMGNIAPQTPSLNRGVWRDVEHRIADLWTSRWGECWVIVGCWSQRHGETVSGSDIDVPLGFYQIVVAQDGMDVRAMAMSFPQNIPYGAWAARNLITIDELEELTGLDFLPDLPGFIQSPLEAELPSRLWPIRWQDVIKLVKLRLF